MGVSTLLRYDYPLLTPSHMQRTHARSPCLPHCLACLSSVPRYMHFPNPASRYPIVGSFVSKSANIVRVAITGAGPCAYRIPEFEAALSSNFAPEAIKDIKVSDDGLNSDIHASAEYRAHLINVMTRRAISN